MQGDQITVIWHVDDLMVSCKDDFEITKFVCYLSGINRPKMTMHSGARHDYLGVIYEFVDQKVEVTMFNFLDKTINEFTEEIKGRAATPAADHLFTIRDVGRERS